jgi:hypothetical protein
MQEEADKQRLFKPKHCEEMMKKEYKNIGQLIRHNLLKNEHPPTHQLINRLKDVRKRGYFTKEEFILMCYWKSPRPLPLYESNRSEGVIEISREVIASKSEKSKMDLLTSLSGVGIPVASAILMLTDPGHYGVLDTRTWQLLYLYDEVSVKPDGKGFAFRDWHNYLNKLRDWSLEFGVDVRKIERTLFEYHKGIQEGALY